MNQTTFQPDANKNGSSVSGERVSNLIKGLGAYFAAVLTDISLIIVIAIFSGWKALEMTGLLSCLAISILFLVFYSVATTKTVNTSINYRLMQIVKRLIDVVMAAVGIFLLMPLFLLLALAIGIESPGPILFRSKCIGQFGRPFDVFKFRTMYLAPREQAITRLGSFLRRYALNELPQLMNVLNGEMSLIGPRIRHPQHLDETLDPEGKILSVRPGISGLWQVSVPLEKDMDLLDLQKDMVRLDLQYVQNWTLALDIKIFFQTFSVVLQNSKSA